MLQMEFKTKTMGSAPLRNCIAATWLNKTKSNFVHTWEGRLNGMESCFQNLLKRGVESLNRDFEGVDAKP
jgi:DNA-binding transcriptional MocR family regulator